MIFSADSLSRHRNRPAQPERFFRLGLLAGIAFTQAIYTAEAQSQSSSCFLTGGGTLEICRGEGEAEGVFFTPRACEFAQNVQVMRLPAGRRASKPLQVIYQAETPLRGGRDDDGCPPDRRATNPFDSGSVRTGGQFEQLATTMPPSAYRLWETPREIVDTADRRGRKRRSQRWQDRDQVVGKISFGAGLEGIGARNPMVVSGRDWMGDEYYYAFLIAPVPVGDGVRHALIQSRTLNFEEFDLRSGSDKDASTQWTPFAATINKEKRRRAPTANPSPAAVLDQDGKPLTGNCSNKSLSAQGLIGSISIVNKVYHYFYTDVLSTDCDQPTLKQRMGLYLRTSEDLTADRVWSTARIVTEKLGPQSLVRVAKAHDDDRWVVSYNCTRPANIQGGPVADICVQYTSSVSIESLQELVWYEEPAASMRSNTYLGLRSGGDDVGRFERAQHFWMTDRYGNLDRPANFTSKAGFLTWVDRLAPRQEGIDGSSVYGRPVYWRTWTVRKVPAK